MATNRTFLLGVDKNPLQAAFGGGGSDAFVAKLDPTGTKLVYSTFLGGTRFENGNAIAVDAAGNAYVTGRSGSQDIPETEADEGFPTVNPFQVAHLDVDRDAYVAKIFEGIELNTPRGSNVVHRPVDARTGATPVIVEFEQVIEAGTTSLVILERDLEPPLGFRLGDPPTYYELTTTAVFALPVTICIEYSGINWNDESQLKLFHFENGEWVELETVSLNTTANVICAKVNSFSPFAILEPDAGDLRRKLEALKDVRDKLEALQRSLP